MQYSVDAFISEILSKKELIEFLIKQEYADAPFNDKDTIKRMLSIMKPANKTEIAGRSYYNSVSPTPIITYRLEAIYYDKPGKLF